MIIQPKLIKTILCPFLFLFALAGIARQASAQGIWTKVSISGPVPRIDPAMAYDGKRGRMVLYGGRSSTSSYLSDTWEWDGSAWTQFNVSGPGSPSSPTMAYYAGSKKVVLYGYVSGHGNTWEWDGKSWSLVNSSGPTGSPSMVFDSGRGRLVLLYSSDGSAWEWDGSAWIKSPSVHPLPRDNGAVAYDSARRKTVVFGGHIWENSLAKALGDTWEWDGASWVQSSSTGPDARTYHALAYDGVRKRTMLFGGLSRPDAYTLIRYFDTWEWDGQAWVLMSTLVPAARSSHALAYDSRRGEVVLFGGQNTSNCLGETWTRGQAAYVIVGKSDFNKDGVSDIAYYRPSKNRWSVYKQRNRTFGKPGDIPVPADYDGDGKTDLAVFRPSQGRWYIQNLPSVALGKDGDTPAPGDYNGDGKTEPAVYRFSEKTWYFAKQPTVAFGEWGDIPVPGDYNGDGKTDVAVFSPSTAKWSIQNQFNRIFGQTGDIPVPADYDGDGKTDPAVFRPSSGKWQVYKKFNVFYGMPGDIPVPGDYDGDGKVDVAVFNPATGTWDIRKQKKVVFGAASDIPLVRGK